MSEPQQTPQTVTARDIYGDEHEVLMSDLLWRPAAIAIVIHDGKILLTRQHGKYELPGGGVEFGEMPEAAAIREADEETGIKVTRPRLVSCLSNIFTLPGMDNPVQSLILFYECDFAGGEFSMAGLDEYEVTWTEMPVWLPLDELENITAGSSYDWRSVVRQVLKRDIARAADQPRSKKV